MFEFDVAVFGAATGFGVFAGLFAVGCGFAAFAGAFAVLPFEAVALEVFEIFELFVAVFEFDVATVGVTAGLAPLSSLGLLTTFLARKFSIFASFIATA